MAHISETEEFGNNEKLLVESSTIAAAGVTGPNVKAAIDALVNVILASNRRVKIFSVDITNFNLGDVLIVVYYKYLN